jgi:hypothetical protein
MMPRKTGMVAVMASYAAAYADQLAREREGAVDGQGTGRMAREEGPPRMAWIGVARRTPARRSAGE